MTSERRTAAKKKPEEAELAEITSPAEIPAFASEDEEAGFWEMHTLSDSFWEHADPIPDDQLPPVRRQSQR